MVQLEFSEKNVFRYGPVIGVLGAGLMNGLLYSRGVVFPMKYYILVGVLMGLSLIIGFVGSLLVDDGFENDWLDRLDEGLAGLDDDEVQIVMVMIVVISSALGFVVLSWGLEAM